jgi:hypothetical protein
MVDRISVCLHQKEYCEICFEHKRAESARTFAITGPFFRSQTLNLYTPAKFLLLQQVLVFTSNNLGFEYYLFRI